ncbi:hypothetical protein V2J09_010602 [Rumex salicifolius]
MPEKYDYASKVKKYDYARECLGINIENDILAYQRRILRIKDLHLSDDQLRNYALVEIEKLLH